MFHYIAVRLGNPKRPLLGFQVNLLKFWGLFIPRSGLMRYVYIFMHVMVAFYVYSAFIEIWFIRDDMKLMLHNLKITALAFVSLCKAFSFIYWQNDWWSVIDYVTKADIAMRNTSDPRKLKLINSYTKYSQKLSIFHCFLMYATIFTLVMPPLFKFLLSPTYRMNAKNGTEPYMQVLSSWVPFDKNTLSGYVAISCFHTYSSICGSGWITSFDCTAFVNMVFIKAELKMLRMDCAEIFGTEKSPVSDEVAVERLKECHRRHVELIKYVRVLDSCLSPNMLLYMVICSFMLCVTAYEITSETNVMQKFMTAEYLIFGIAQLFIYCWHSTDVFYASLELSRGPYESLWWNRGASQNKNIYILTAQFNKPVVFTAGPFTALTMTTYINIIKGSYSYYTLLRKSQMKYDTEI